MASSLRDDLASLSIDRGRDRVVAADSAKSDPRGIRGDGGIRLLGLLIWMIPLGLLAAAGVYGYGQYDQLRAKPEVTIGVVQLMTTGEAETLLDAKGYLKSQHQALIGAKVPGRVERMLVDIGSKVKKGDVLAVLEHKDLDALLASRKAMLQRNEAELLEARVDLRQKEREAARADRLQAQRMLSLEEKEKADSAFSMCQARVAALEASIELTLASLGLMDVEADIAENLLSRVALNQPAEVSVSAVPSRRYKGRLRQIVPMGDRTRGTIKVKVEILDPDERLFPELVATVHFLPDKALNNPDASRPFLFVPKAALYEANGHEYVWVVDSRSALRKRAVEVAVTNAEVARVESGLNAGESVVLNPARTLREGTVVKASD
jgi:multidrug efflux pump subunit AcrA (membrane-fusion protein)